MFIRVKYGENETLLCNPSCAAINLLHSIKRRTGYSDRTIVVDLSDEKGLQFIIGCYPYFSSLSIYTCLSDCVPLSACIFLCLCLYDSISLSLCLSISLCVYTWLSVCVSLSACLSVHGSLPLFPSLPFALALALSFHVRLS